MIYWERKMSEGIDWKVFLKMRMKVDEVYLILKVKPLNIVDVTLFFHDLIVNSSLHWSIGQFCIKIYNKSVQTNYKSTTIKK